jgi:hypothetical protein
MKHRVPHDLDPATARKVAEKAWESYSERFAKYKPTMAWVRENEARIGFRAKGISLSGVLELAEGAIDMDLEVPLLLRPFKKTAIDVIEQEIRKWVAKAKNGDL